MVRKEARHDSRVSQKRTVGALNRPTRNALLHVRCAIPIELLIAPDLINRPALVGHHLRIGVHLCKRCAVLVMPGAKLQSLCLDHRLSVSPNESLLLSRCSCCHRVMGVAIGRRSESLRHRRAEHEANQTGEPIETILV
jgi:hypothetical protein